MTVIINSPYAGNPVGSVLDLDNATEAALVAQRRAVYSGASPGPVFGPFTPAEVQSMRDTNPAVQALVSADGIDAPTGTPTAAVGGAGVLTGAYYYSVAYRTALGISAPWPGTATVVNPTADVVELTNIPIGPEGTTGRVLLRTPATPVDPKDYRILAEIADNTTTTYTDNIADGSLGAPASWGATNRGIFREADGSVFATFSDQSTSLGQGTFAANVGYASVAIGFECLKENTTGRRNTGVGVYALNKNTTGYRNVAIGTHALNENTTGFENVAVGFGALFVYPSGGTNTAVGGQSLQSLSSGTGANTAVGWKTLLNSTSGNNNTAVGESVMINNLVGTGNTVVGSTAAFLSTGSQNTYFGLAAGYNVTTAGNNVGVGAGALQNAAATAGQCIAVGYRAGRYADASSQVYIDPIDRTNTANGKAQSLIYGVANATPSSQTLVINAATKTGVDVAVAGLPAASAALKGYRMWVTDANATHTAGNGAVVAAGGANYVPVYCDGAAWRIG